MKLTLGEVTYQSDLMALYRLSIAEARVIKRQTGMTLADWRFSLITYFREDPDMLAGLVYLLKHRAGEVVDWDEIGLINAQDVIDGAKFEESDAEQLARIQGSDVVSEDEGGQEQPIEPDAQPEQEEPVTA